MPVPISTPGFDACPYLTATICVTKDPETGVRNMGTYRGALKATDRLGVRMASRLGGAGGYVHWQKHQKLGTPMPVAIVIGCAPAIFFTGPQKLAIDFDEMGVAGALIGEPIKIVRCITNDLEVPADSEIVIEGLIDPELLEPEGPFGESHGHVALEDYNMSMQVTAITMKKSPVFVSIISQVTPSESSVTKKVAYEPLFLAHLRDHLVRQGHQARRHARAAHQCAPRDLPELRARHAAHRSVARSARRRHAASPMRQDRHRARRGHRCVQHRCGVLVDGLSRQHGRGPPRRAVQVRRPRPEIRTARSDATLLIDATPKHPMPPFALPAKEYMEHAKVLWDELGLPALTPQPPWYGYSLGDWNDTWDTWAKRAVEGKWEETGKDTFARRKGGIIPETPVRSVKDKGKKD